MPFDSVVEVKESTTQQAADLLGAGLREARRSHGFTQQALAAAACIDLATVRGLERGIGTVGPLRAVLRVLRRRFVDQPSGVDLGEWLATCRKAAGYSQADAAILIGVSKPTVIQIEHGRGNLRSFFALLRLLSLNVSVVSLEDPFHGARLLLGDCLDIMPTLPDRSVHAIIADLPYSLTALEWDRPIPLEPLWEQFRRLLTPTGVVVLSASQPFTADLVMSNREWFKYALVWEKSRPTGFLQAKTRHLKKHEDLLVYSPQTSAKMTYNPQGLVKLEHPVRSRNGNMTGGALRYKGGHNTVGPNLRQTGAPSTFNGEPIRGGGRHQTHTNYPTSVLRFASETKPIHPTQKPVDLYRYLVSTFSNEGDTVLDCCFGSGTTGVAAIMEGRQFIGIEKDEDYFSLAQKRMMEVGRPR